MVSKARTTLDSFMSEDDFLNKIIQLARYQGWLMHHCRPALSKSGRYHTPISGDKGFPDIVLVKGPYLAIWELKISKGVVSHEQNVWLDKLDFMRASVASNYINIGVRRPKDWDEIERFLCQPINQFSL